MRRLQPPAVRWLSPAAIPLQGGIGMLCDGDRNPRKLHSARYGATATATNGATVFATAVIPP